MQVGQVVGLHGCWPRAGNRRLAETLNLNPDPLTGARCHASVSDFPGAVLVDPAATGTGCGATN